METHGSDPRTDAKPLILKGGDWKLAGGILGTILVIAIVFVAGAFGIARLSARQREARGKVYDNCQTWYDAAKDSHTQFAASAASDDIQVRQTWLLLSQSESNLYLACMERNKY